MKNPDDHGGGKPLGNTTNSHAPYKKPVVTIQGQLRDLTAVTSGGETLGRCPDIPGGGGICEPTF